MRGYENDELVTTNSIESSIPKQPEHYKLSSAFPPIIWSLLDYRRKRKIVWIPQP